jgi:hypothetical protein
VLVQNFALQSFATLIFSAEAYLSFRSRKVATRLREGGNTQPMRVNQSAVYVLLVTGIQHPIQFRRVSLGDTRTRCGLSRDYLSPKKSREAFAPRPETCSP